MFELRKRLKACENSRFEVFLDDIRSRSGESVDNYLVVQPKLHGADCITGVAVLPVMEGKIGLLRLYRHAVQADCWEIPRGFVDPGEAPDASALRELEEETGLSCAADRLLQLGTVMPEAGVLAARVALYAAENCFSAKDYQASELGHHELRFFDPERVGQMLDASEIQDPCTAIAYYKYVFKIGLS